MIIATLCIHAPTEDTEERGIIRGSFVDHSRSVHYYICVFLQYRVNLGYIATFGLAWLGYKQKDCTVSDWLI
jgi:hypothetical protein